MKKRVYLYILYLYTYIYICILIFVSYTLYIWNFLLFSIVKVVQDREFAWHMFRIKK